MFEEEKIRNEKFNKEIKNTNNALNKNIEEEEKKDQENTKKKMNQKIKK